MCVRERGAERERQGERGREREAGREAERETQRDREREAGREIQLERAETGVIAPVII